MRSQCIRLATSYRNRSIYDKWIESRLVRSISYAGIHPNPSLATEQSCISRHQIHIIHSIKSMSRPSVIHPPSFQLIPSFNHPRCYTSKPLDHESQANPSASLDEGTFLKLANHTLSSLADAIESQAESTLGDEFDSEYSQGVLTLRFSQTGGQTYVINTQTPNRQIWMSSPVSGPWRYNWHPGMSENESESTKNGCWRSSRDGHLLRERLNKELMELAKIAVPLKEEEFH